MTQNKKHELKVSLVGPQGARVVDVDQPPDGHEVEPDDEPQLMVWKLTGNAVGFSFVSTDPSDPAFAWKDPKPKNGIFGKPQIGSIGDELTITNNHKKNGDNKGDFIYQLRIQKGSEICKTLYIPEQGKPAPVDDETGPAPVDPCNSKKRVTTNPRIKNT